MLYVPYSFGSGFGWMLFDREVMPSDEDGIREIVKQIERTEHIKGVIPMGFQLLPKASDKQDDNMKTCTTCGARHHIGAMCPKCYADLA